MFRGCLMDNEFILDDRLSKIRQIINKYGADNFYLSFSGGKDSCVLSWLIDRAFPDNNIPRVYANTGIELNMIRDFVYKLAESDKRIFILKPIIPIIPMLERDGYPFKSKKHAKKVGTFQRHGMTKTALNYLNPSNDCKTFGCPEKLKYQFTPEFKERLKVDYKCCVNLKEKPLHDWAIVNGKAYSILGLRKEEGGSRAKAKCLAFSGNNLKAFHPLIVCSDSWENWLINEYCIDICDIYKPPYNFERTGCKGCPFNINLQHELDVLQTYFPNERKQCEIIWKPVYNEYRRLGYRLKNDLVSNFYDNILGGD